MVAGLPSEACKITQVSEQGVGDLTCNVRNEVTPPLITSDHGDHHVMSFRIADSLSTAEASRIIVGKDVGDIARFCIDFHQRKWSVDVSKHFTRDLATFKLWSPTTMQHLKLARHARTPGLPP